VTAGLERSGNPDVLEEVKSKDQRFFINDDFPHAYEGESNENRKNFFKFNLLNESGTQLYNFST
jgi:hypothetical protein